MADPFQPKFVDLVRNHSTTVGTGNFVLGPAVNGYASLATAVAIGDQFYYSAIGVDKPAEREVGRGTLVVGGTISREPVSGPKTNFTSGTKAIALIAAAEWFSTIQAASTGSGPSAALDFVATRTELAARATNRPAALLTENGRDGVFFFVSGNLSAQVTADVAQGVYVAPTSNVSGSAGAWVRRYSGPLDIRWFGGKADCTALVGSAFNGTDNSAALASAKTVLALTLGGALHFPQGNGAYRFASRQVFTGGIKITGDGWHENPGQVGATTYIGVQKYPGTVLCFDADVGGFQFIAFTDNNANATALEFQSSSGSIVRDIMFYSGGGTGVTAHGLEARAKIHTQNVRIENFAGSGLRQEAWSAGAVPYGSTDAATHIGLVCRFNRLHGIHNLGDDANVMSFIASDTALNGGCGVLDAGMLGNCYTVPHAATNNQSHPSNTYAASHSAAQRAQVLADAPFLSDRYSGSYYTTSAVGSHLFLNGYSEPGEGMVASLADATTVIGGGLAASISLTPTTKAFVLNQGFANRKAISGLNELHPTFKVAAGLGIDPSLNNKCAFWFGSDDDVPTMDGFKLCKDFQWAGVWTLQRGNSIQIEEYVTNAHASSALTNGYAKGFPNGIYMGTVQNCPRLLPAAAAAPTSGSYRTGDRIFNSAPTAGGVHSWYCTVGGSPGTWVATTAPSGSNSGDQTITLTGDVTGSGTASFATAISANSVTFAKLVAASGAALVGATAAGNFAELAPAAARSTLGLAAIATSGSGADLAVASLPYAKVQNVSATDKLLGRSSAGAGVIEEIICTAAGRALIDDVDATAQRATLGLAALAASGSGADLAAASVPYARVQNVAASRLLGNPTGAATSAAEISLAGGLAFSGTTLTAAGALTPTSIASSGAVTSSAVSGIGYAAGAGGAVTQLTSRTTGVTLNKASGAITLFSTTTTAGQVTTFTVTNSSVVATDTINLGVKSGTGVYLALVTAVGGGTFNISVHTPAAVGTAEAPVINFALVKAVAA